MPHIFSNGVVTCLDTGPDCLDLNPDLSAYQRYGCASDSRLCATTSSTTRYEGSQHHRHKVVWGTELVHSWEALSAMSYVVSTIPVLVKYIV